MLSDHTICRATNEKWVAHPVTSCLTLFSCTLFLMFQFTLFKLIKECENLPPQEGPSAENTCKNMVNNNIDKIFSVRLSAFYYIMGFYGNHSRLFLFSVISNGGAAVGISSVVQWRKSWSFCLKILCILSRGLAHLWATQKKKSEFFSLQMPCSVLFHQFKCCCLRFSLWECLNDSLFIAKLVCKFGERFIRISIESEFYMTEWGFFICALSPKKRLLR